MCILKTNGNIISTDSMFHLMWSSHNSHDNHIIIRLCGWRIGSKKGANSSTPMKERTNKRLDIIHSHSRKIDAHTWHPFITQYEYSEWWNLKRSNIQQHSTSPVFPFSFYTLTGRGEIHNQLVASARYIISHKLWIGTHWHRHLVCTVDLPPYRESRLLIY